LNDIFTKPWFDRTWTVYELALSLDGLRLLCGSSTICWECIEVANRELGEFLNLCTQADESSDYWALSGVASTVLFLKVAALSEIRSWVGAATQLQKQGQATSSYFSRIISYTHHSLCTDPRDKVYGLLGIAELDAPAAIPIDYTKSIQNVHMRTTMYIMVKTGFSILPLQGMWPVPEGWPSGVVDFQKPMPNNYMPLVKPYGIYGSTYSTLPYSEHDTVANFLPRKVLRVYGLLIDEVVETSAFWTTGKSKGAAGYRELLLSQDVFYLFFLRAARSEIEWSTGKHSPQYTYSPRNSARKSGLADAVLRALVAD
jgi:hypothetical protein